MNKQTETGLDIEKMFFIYETMLLLEEKRSKYLRIKELEKKVISSRNLNTECERNIKISKLEFRKFLQCLLAYGIVFFPLGGVVQRVLTFKWGEVKKSEINYHPPKI